MEKFMHMGSVLENPEKKEKRFENIVTVETENATYDIVYSLHDKITNPEIIGEADGVVLEMMSDFSSEEGAREGLNVMRKKDINPYEKVIESAAKNEKPLFLVDISKNANNYLEMGKVDKKASNYGLGEYALGAVTLMYGASKVNQSWEEKRMSRRQFLKIVSATATSAYLMSPLFQYLMGEVSTSMTSKEPEESSISRKTEKFLERVNYAIHPELRSLTMDMRNDLIAQKSETAAREFFKENESKPRLAILIGAAHCGIERSLEKSEDDRVEDIKKVIGDRVREESYIAKVDLPKDFNGNVYDAKVSIIKDKAMEK